MDRDHRHVRALLADHSEIQLQEMEILAVYRAIVAKPGCNMLVFGLGNDSALWCEINSGGRTAFLEHDPSWIDIVRDANPGIESHVVGYPNDITQWSGLVDEPERLEMELPRVVTDTEWDVVLVDGPPGYVFDTLLPGRMSSIFMASRLVRKGGTVFVHDTEREVERTYCDRYLGAGNLVRTVNGRAQLSEYRMPGDIPTITLESWNGAMYKGYIVVSVEPLILVYTGTFQDRPDTVIPEPPSGTEPDVVIELMSWHLSRTMAEGIARRYARDNGGPHRMLMTSAEDEDRHRIAAGIDGFLCHKEIFALEDVFTPNTRVMQRYNAIYTARIDAFKRHELASRVKHLRLLTGGKGRARFQTGLDDVASSDAKPFRLHATATASFESLGLADVAREINRSACGLALSATEGVMRASTQYLLCGKPVVSTRSRGGRDVFYDDVTAIVVGDDADEVWDAVRTLVTDRRDPFEIRRRTLERIHGFRYEFARRIASIRSRFGGDPVAPERILFELFFSERNYRTRYVGSGGALDPDPDRYRYRAGCPDRFRFRRDRYRMTEADSDNELVDTTTGTAVAVLSGSAAFILARFDGHTSVQDIVNDLRECYPGETGLESDVRDAVRRFIDIGAIEVHFEND